MVDLLRVHEAFRRYIDARNALLDELRLSRKSNRDPLAEFGEWLVAALVSGTLADSPVQPGWDVRGPDGERIQVKYLANPADRWVNEHPVHVTDLMDSYAIVVFEALLPKAVVILPARNLAAVGTEMGKRHGNLDTTLQFTRANYRRILQDAAAFKELGVRLYVAPDWTVQ